MQVDRTMYTRVVDGSTWKKKPPPRQFPAMKCPAFCQPSLTTRATRLGAHNPVCDSYMCDWLTGRHGPALWQPVELPCTTQSTFTTTISYFLPYLCFVSALSQSIAAFRRPVERNLQRISWITPRWRLRDSSDALLQGMGHEPPTNKEDYRWKSSPVRSNSIAHIAHFRSLQ